MSDKKIGAFKGILAKYRNIISSVIYMLLVFVVIYGMSSGVYNGFPTIIPYVIIALFLFMAFMRLYQFIMGIPSKKDSDKSDDEKKQ